MRFLDCDDNYLGVLEEAKELPKSIIRSVIIETPEEEQQLRLFLMGALKVDERGCHALGCNIGSNTLAINTDATNRDMSLGNDASKNTGLKFDYSLEEKLRIIDTLASALKKENSVFYEHTKETEEKLLVLIQSI